MTQNRPPPAFQEYAANMMASVEYRALGLAERGLLYTMRLECWVNQRLPNKPETLARVLGFDNEEINAALPAIMHFFAIQGGHIVCPELEDYRSHLQGIRDRQSDGGKKGAEKTNGRRTPNRKTQATQGDSANPASNPRVTCGSTRESLVKLSSVQPSKNQPLGRDVSDDGWLSDYEAASNGR
ncbi:MAG: hypothetical protein ACM3X0_05775 [Bacteroidota bacterium]